LPRAASEGDQSDEDGDGDDNEEFTSPPRTTISAFAMIDDDSSSDQDDEDEADDEVGDSAVDDDGDDANDERNFKDPAEDWPGDHGPARKQTGPSAAAATSDDSVTEDADEDLDALLEEFKMQDGARDESAPSGAPNDGQKAWSWYSIVTVGIETRDLDIDYVMRTSLLGSTEGSGPPRSAAARRGQRHAALFGPPRDNWPRPPHYVGGGMGMTTYDDEGSINAPSSESGRQAKSTLRSPPWPYSAMKEGDDRCPNASKWVKYTHSDNYARDCQDFETIKASGDANALGMFVAHHPFAVEALLQLSAVLYQTNQSQEGLSLLKRALWVYECASMNSFLNVEGPISLMDFELIENKHFFNALFRLVRVSYVAGLTRACFAVSRFLLSLDPLRDPMNVLLAIDSFALLCNTEACNEWLISFVDSRKVRIIHSPYFSSALRFRVIFIANCMIVI
jgi:Transcriptional repressor TCF25